MAGDFLFRLSKGKKVMAFLGVVRKLGISMKVVDGAEFGRALEQTMRNMDTEYIFEALQNDMDEQQYPYYE